MDKKVKIMMTNGTEKYLADLTPADLPNVKLAIRADGKHKGKTNLTLKSEVVKETDTHKVERRLFKWATMPIVAMYELAIPKTLQTFIKEKTDVVVLAYAIGNYAIEMDKLNNGVEGTGLSKGSKELAKEIDKVDIETQNEIRAFLATKGITMEQFVQMKKDKVKQGVSNRK